jgi:ABC-type multidrug transport system fused ATPase/permease subunit
MNQCITVRASFRYGIAFLYGWKLVQDDDYTAGKVMNVIFATIIGGFSLGQIGPNFNYFAAGKAAGTRLYKVINRTPSIDVTAEGLIPTTPLLVRIEFNLFC